MNKCLKRRQFLSTSAKASAVFAAPLVLPRRVWGANDRIALGYVGCKNRGGQNMAAFHASKRVDHVASADPDSRILDEFDEKLRKRGAAPSARYTDYREMLGRDDLDAVVVSTPDHWHALPTIDACRAGLDVYCEKPLTLFPTEGERMVAVARETGRVVQTGSQQRSGREFHQAHKIVTEGKLGKIEQVFVGLGKSNHPGPVGPSEEPPKELDYDLWLGPAPFSPYVEKKLHYNFRFWWDYSGGQVTNWGAHNLDIARWCLGLDRVAPTKASGTATFHPDRVHEVTEGLRITVSHDGAPEIVVGQLEKDCPMGVTFVGTEGRLHVWRGTLKCSDESLHDTEVDVPKGDSHKQHVVRFLDAMQTRERPNADVAVGHGTAEACHLINACARLGRDVIYDGNDAEAAKILDRPYRSPWSLEGMIAAK